MPSQRTLDAVFWTAVAVSIVHYTDNYVSYDEFPQATSGPNPSELTILVAWFVFTAFGLAGYALFRRGRVRAAALCLGVYSISGVIGIGHYTVGGMTDAVWWRQAHVIADIVLGIAVLAVAFAIARSAGRAPQAQPLPR
jgi:hypothetical protein